MKEHIRYEKNTESLTYIHTYRNSCCIKKRSQDLPVKFYIFYLKFSKIFSTKIRVDDFINVNLGFAHKFFAQSRYRSQQLEVLCTLTLSRRRINFFAL